MGVRERLWRWLARGDAGEVDPEVEVEIADVMLHEGPMLVAALERAGITARGVETWSLVSEVTDRMRILVRAADAARALDVVQRAGSRRRLPPR